MNNQEAHCQGYYKIYALSIMRPTEVLIVILVKLDHFKVACPYYAHKVKATDNFFKLHVAVTCLNKIPYDCIKDMRCVVGVYAKCLMSSMHLVLMSNLYCLDIVCYDMHDHT